MPSSVWVQFHVRYLSFTAFSMLVEPPSVRMDRSHLKPSCEGAWSDLLIQAMDL